MTFLLGCLASRWRRVTLAFDFIDLLLHHGKPVDLALDLTGDSRRQAATVSGNERVDGQSLVLRFDIEVANALAEQQPLDAVDVCGPLADQPTALTMRTPQVLFVNTRNADYRPNVPLTPAPSDESTKQHLHVHSVGLHRPSTTVHFEAARVNQKALYAPRLEEPRKPKGVVTHFVAKRDRRHSATRLRPTIPRRGELRHQAFSIAASHRVNAWLLMVRKLDRQKPTVLAQF